MRNSVTIIACALLCLYGAKVASIGEVESSNKIVAAEPYSISAALKPIEIHDTITASDTIRDTVFQYKYKIKYKSKRSSCATCDSTVSLTCVSDRGIRKETSPDTIPAKPRWYRVHGIVEPIEVSETRLYIPVSRGRASTLPRPLELTSAR